MTQGKRGSAKSPLSLRLPRELLETIEARGGKNEVIELALQRYFESIRAAKRSLRQKFMDSELNLIMDVCNGWLIDAHINFIWAEVADGIKLNHLDEKWGVEDEEELVLKLRNLSPIQLYALHDAIILFWRDENGTLDDAFQA